MWKEITSLAGDIILQNVQKTFTKSVGDTGTVDIDTWLL
jgi:hypothetical protein